jgi:two-component system, sensor histidine kinase and response regulator
MVKILVIEDEQSLSNSILEILIMDGFEAEAAENGLVGLQRAKQDPPDLILCDVEMPELSGHEVLSSLRQDPATAMVPFLFLTALSERPDLRYGMELGADDYISKPFRADELRRAIATQLDKKNHREQDAEGRLERLRSSITQALPLELSTPLSKVMGTVKLLIAEQGTIQPEESLTLLQSIQGSVERLNRQIENFLLYAQLELLINDPQSLQFLREQQPGTSARLVIGSTVHKTALRANRVSDLELDLDNAVIPVADSDLQKMTEELLDNAIKFSTSGTSIQIKSRQVDQDFILCITDHGQGMTAKQIADGGAYMQFDRKLLDCQGTGLGLAIVGQLAKLYGGRMVVESVPNLMTSITVYFPLQYSCS